MKSNLLICLIAITILLIPNTNFGQAPNLGSASKFVLFTSGGAVSNTGISQITGNVGTNSGSSTAFGNVNGVMHDNDGVTAQCASDLLIAYNQLNNTVANYFPAPLLGNGQTLYAGIYSISSPATLNLGLTFDAQNDENAVFIVKIQGSFSAAANSKIYLKNGAKACNIFWKIEGLVSLASAVTMRGTIIANNAAINMSTGDTLEGRALSTTGAITLDGTMAYTPIGCGSPTLTGPAAPNLSTVACYTLFSSNGPTTNVGVTHVLGDVGTNLGLTTGFNPLFVTGAIHPIPDGSTSACATDLLSVYTYLNTLPTDIELLYPAQFGNNLVLTPHTYLLNAATTFTDTLFLNAEGNANAVFVIKIKGALSTSTYSKVVLKNGTLAKNVFWMVDGAVSINDYSIFNGTIICNNGAINLMTGVNIEGRALSTTGALNTSAIDIRMPPGCGGSSSPLLITNLTNQTVCEGNSASFTVTATGTNLTYQWRKGFLNLVDGGNISGSTSNTLTINPVSISDTAYNYNVVIKGTFSPSTTSANASLTVNTAPVISIEPLNNSVCEAGVATFTVAATGNSLSYQWRKGTQDLINGGNISGATSTVLTISPADISDASSNYNVIVSGICEPSDTSINAILVVNTAPKIINEPISKTVCKGNSVSFFVDAIGMDLTYQWRKGNVNITNGANITDATSDTLTINPVNFSDTASNYNVVISGTCFPNDTSINVSLKLNSTTILTEPMNQNVCIGSSANYSIVASGLGLTYQWRKGSINLINGIHYSGAASSSLIINAISISDTASNYNVIVSGTCAPSDTSINVSLLAIPTTAITLNPTNTIVCTGNSAVFSATASGSNLTYQWRKGNSDLANGSNISGATTAILTINPATSADASTDYNVVVTGLCLPNITSTNASLVVNQNNSIQSQPISQTACVGSSIIFSVTSTGTGLTYQWRKGNVNLINGGNILGATSSVLIINPITMQDTASNYNVFVSGSCSASETSTNASLLINSAPSITLNPRDTIVCEGNIVYFSTTAIGSNLQYQWRKGLTNITNGGNVAGATTATLTINPANVSDAASDYNVVITGTCTPIITSTNASLAVNTKTYITNEPLNQTVCSGNTASFTVTATGTNLTYQWRKGLVNMANTGNITGVNTATLIFNAATISDTASNYNVVVSGTCIPGETSINVILSINPSTIISLEPTNQVVCEGNSVSFIVTATGYGLTYQWRKGNTLLTDGGNISGATTATLTINPANSSDAGSNYNLVMNGTCLPITTSNSASLIVYTSANLTTQPLDQTACIGNSASFNVAATGANLTYQWRKGTQILTNGGNISGATSSTLTINPVSSTDASSDYNIIVSGTCLPSETSIDATLFVNEPTTILTQPSPQTICNGSAANFTVIATGTNNVYQWRKGTQNINDNGNTTGANTSSLNISPTTGLDSASNYNVTISGGCLPIVTSIDVELTLNSKPLAKANCNSPICIGGPIYLYTEYIANATYQWTGTNGYTSQIQNPIFTSMSGTESGTYSLIVSTPYCASDSSSVNLKVLNCVGLNIPEGFSPNGDGINDKFIIRGIDNFPNNTIVIFNRWGDKIYEASPYINEWDGKPTMGVRDNGELLPNATYFYLLNLGDNSEIIKGTIYLNK